jgi:sulfatase maturation enzyme AslB (radical SAM superfamily)
MLVEQEIMSFFLENNFEVHISLNGSPVLNNEMRDNSTALVVKNIRKYSELL